MSLYRGTLRCDRCGAQLDPADTKAYIVLSYTDKATSHTRTHTICRNRAHPGTLSLTEGCESALLSTDILDFYLHTILPDSLNTEPQR